MTTFHKGPCQYLTTGTCTCGANLPMPGQAERVHFAASIAADAMYTFLYEDSKHLSCVEFNAMVGLYHELGQMNTARILLAESDHVLNDDPDDLHYRENR